jgi:hypothetical protein
MPIDVHPKRKKGPTPEEIVAQQKEDAERRSNRVQWQLRSRRCPQCRTPALISNGTSTRLHRR